MATTRAVLKQTSLKEVIDDWCRKLDLLLDEDHSDTIQTTLHRAETAVGSIGEMIQQLRQLRDQEQAIETWQQEHPDDGPVKIDNNLKSGFTKSGCIFQSKPRPTEDYAHCVLYCLGNNAIVSTSLMVALELAIPPHAPTASRAFPNLVVKFGKFIALAKIEQYGEKLCHAIDQHPDPPDVKKSYPGFSGPRWYAVHYGAEGQRKMVI
ncbi:hypothetical protein K435DRAFT_810310 [Dendrothele bispora CBS 962.96]|uniref:Uncharacterized protein n=1 Tax=Dendrothele bispora (strain CBS 962.96) TaxID=1314807 RepID=A0A4V4HBM1_DENBC|nr:hypothetical protein K435DRAFT_810310 [Dendrothele bispora CBS 962.96]